MSMRWSQKVAAGIGHIAALADCELANHELTEMACRCDACTGEVPDDDHEGAFDLDAACRCDGRPYAERCEGCRTTEEWAEALSWLAALRARKHRPADAAAEKYRRICKHLGFNPEVRFVTVHRDGRIGCSIGKPDEYRSLLRAVRDGGYIPHPKLLKMAAL